MSEPTAADGTKGERGRWWVLLFEVPWLSLVLGALLAAVIFGPMTRWEAWVSEWNLSAEKGSVFVSPRSPDGRRILAHVDSPDGAWSLRLWDMATGAVVADLGGDIPPLAEADISPDGKLIALVDYEGYALVWCADSDNEHFLIGGGRCTVNCVTFSPDGEILAAGCYHGARIYDTKTGEELAVLDKHKDSVDSVVFSADGRKVVTLSCSGPAYRDWVPRVWDTETWRQLAALEGHEERVNAVCVSPDGTCVATASSDKTARVWNAQTGQCLAVLHQHGDAVTCCNYSPDGRRIITGTTDKALLWDAGDCALVSTLDTTGETVLSVAFSHDGRRIVAGCSQSLRVWDSRSGALLAKLEGVGPRTTVAFSPGDHRIVADSVPHCVSIWRRRRPEWWWGVFWLPEFWLACALGAAFVWSAVRDLRRLRKKTSRA